MSLSPTVNGSGTEDCRSLLALAELVESVPRLLRRALLLETTGGGQDNIRPRLTRQNSSISLHRLLPALPSSPPPPPPPLPIWEMPTEGVSARTWSHFRRCVCEGGGRGAFESQTALD